jgi:hypothetical protein
MPASQWILRAIEHRGRHRLAESLECLHRALTIEPDSARARYELACAQLLAGNYLDGFGNYDSRWEAAGVPRPAHTDQALLGEQWRGENVSGRRILLHAEQGFGDTIQFIRYVPLVAKLGAEVVVEVQPALRDLAGCMVLDCKVGTGVPNGQFDFHCSLVDLPAVFRTRPRTVPAPVSIDVPERLKEEWQARLPHSKRTRVGLVWAGSPKNSTDRVRSIRLELLRPILGAVGDAEFFSFQVGAGREQLETFRDRVTDLTPYLHNFADTAAALQRMDRVISVDTAVAHLAGSLGLNVWLLLSYTPCWRWLLDTSRSPWYPSVKLVRQRSFGDWEPVVTALKKELYNIKL